MSMFSEILEGIPTNSVLRQRVELAEERYNFMKEKLTDCEKRFAESQSEIERLNALVVELRNQSSTEQKIELSDRDGAILVRLHREPDQDGCTETTLAAAISSDIGTTRYHIGRLRKCGLVRRRPGFIFGDERIREETFYITHSGRIAVVENGSS